ncbi:hypothetical protein GOQ04_03345 [Emticicia sp. ODNR4P]|nr:hypothetical protein [Emticicia sp. ODNR4P]
MEDENLVYVGDNILSVEQATLFRFSSAKSLLSSTPKQVITENPELKDNASISSEFARYGEDNTYPNRIAKIIESNNTLKGAIPKRCAAIFGSGIKTAVWEDDFTRKPVNYQPFRNFLRANNRISEDIYQLIHDLLIYRWCVPQFHFSLDRKTIIGISSRRVVDTRLGYDDTNKKLSNAIFVNFDWEQYGHDSKSRIEVAKNPFSHFVVENLKLQSNLPSTLAHVIMHPHNELIYPKAAIHAAVEQGWVDISQDEARYIKALISNKATVLTVVEIADWYWPAKYGVEVWKSKTPAEKTAIRKKEITDFNSMVAGAQNAGKTLLVDVKTDVMRNATKDGNTLGNPDLNKKMPGWTITTVDMPKMDSTLTESANIARKELFWSVGLDWLTSGGVTQQNQTGGSAKGTSKNIEIVLDEFLRQQIIQIFNIISRYNGWDQNIDFEFDLPVMQTLATMAPSERQIKPSNANA